MSRFVSLFGSFFTASAHGESESSGDVIMHHLTDRAADFNFVNWINSHFFSQKFFGFLDMKVTWWVLMVWGATILVFLIFLPLSRSIVKSINGSNSRWVNLWEVLIEFVEKEVVEPSFGHKTKKVTPFFLTIFFFILICNFVGFIPGLNTPTGNLAVTAALASIILILMLFVGFRKHGPLWLFTGLMPKGLPVAMLPLMWVIELSSLFMKPLVLMIRLFANMLAGHMMIIVFIMLIIMFQNLFVAAGSIPCTLFVYALEVIVCFVQAYVFTMLSAIFIASCMEESH